MEKLHFTDKYKICQSFNKFAEETLVNNVPITRHCIYHTTAHSSTQKSTDTEKQVGDNW